MGDLVAQHRVANVRGDFFVFKLGRVHTDECHRIPGVAFLQFDEVGENVNAVDTAVRPEIEYHYFAGQLFAERQWWGVEPVLALRKLRRLEGFRPLIDPLDVRPELLKQLWKALAARRQVSRLAKRRE